MNPRKRLRREGRDRTALYTIGVALVMAVMFVLQGIWVEKNKSKFQSSWSAGIQTQQLRCLHCGGIGTIREENNPTRINMCPVCFGVGSRQVRVLNNLETVCPVCGGVGRVWVEEGGFTLTCPRCDGRGLILLNAEFPAPDPSTNDTGAVASDVK